MQWSADARFRLLGCSRPFSAIRTETFPDQPDQICSAKLLNGLSGYLCDAPTPGRRRGKNPGAWVVGDCRLIILHIGSMMSSARVHDCLGKDRLRLRTIGLDSSF